MANYIQGIQTSVGVSKYDYNALGNIPESDKTLTLSGTFADALVTGQKISALSSRVKELEATVKTLKEKVDALTK